MTSNVLCTKTANTILHSLNIWSEKVVEKCLAVVVEAHPKLYFDVSLKEEIINCQVW